MQHVNEKWLRYVNYYFVVFTIGLLALYTYFALQQQSALVTGKEAYGLGISTLIFALLFVTYNATLLPTIRKSNIWLAYVISFGFFALTNNAATEISLAHTGSIVFYVHNILFAFASTMLGPMVAILVISITGVVFGMTVAGSTSPSIFGIAGDSVALIIRTVGMTILLYLLRNKYIYPANQTNRNYIENYLVNNEAVHLLTNSISDGVIIIDDKQIIRSVNEAALELFDQKEKDILDLNYRSILKLKNTSGLEIKPEEEPVSLALSKLEPIQQELLLSTNSGPEVFIDIAISVIKDHASHKLYGAIIIIRDISKQKQEEAARSEFISTASHEMRTPVAAIEGYLALALNENVSKIDDKAREFLQKAHQNTKRLGRLFQDLLASARAEDGHIVSNPEILELGSFLEQIIDELRLITAKKGLGIEFVTSGGNKSSGTGDRVVRPLYYVYADPDRLQETITNLFDNAVKYTDSGKITLGLTGNKEVVQFFIKDTGAGIPAEDIPHLFQKFYRVDNRDTRTTGGTGLGLFICKKIIELYKGRIWAESELGKGSTFFVNLPRIDSTKATLVHNQPTNQSPAT